jgi:hypothetical protein
LDKIESEIAQELAKSQSGGAVQSNSTAALGNHLNQPNSDRPVPPAAARQPERSLDPMMFLKGGNANAVKLFSAGQADTAAISAEDMQDPVQPEGDSAARTENSKQQYLDRKRELKNYKKEFERYSNKCRGLFILMCSLSDKGLSARLHLEAKGSLSKMSSSGKISVDLSDSYLLQHALMHTIMLYCLYY